MSHFPVQTDDPHNAPIRWRSSRRVLMGYCGTGFLVMLFAALFMLSTSDWVLNSRRVLAGVALPLAGAALFLLLFIQVMSSPARADHWWSSVFDARRLRLLPWLAGVVFAAPTLLALTPSSGLRRLAAYHEALLPFLIAFSVTGGMAFGIVLVQLYGVHPDSLKSFIQTNRRAWIAALISLGVMLAIWLFIVLTGRGVRSTEDYWFGAGTPLLFQQLLLSLFIAYLFSAFETRIMVWVESKTRSKVSPDLVLFFLIWVITAILWAIPPAPSGFMTLRPLLPNNELYPFADALRYDLGSQFALIGQGLNDGRFYYRVFYVAYLFVLHSLFGQHYERLMTAQAVLFAVFPGLVYLLGKTLRSRTFGMLAAAIAALVGFNSIIGSVSADVANPKQMLTDFPTAIGVAGFTLLAVHWWNNPGRTSKLFWLAGVLGIAALVRTSAFGLLPVLLLLIWVAVPRAWMGKIILSMVALTVFLASAFPWSIQHGRFVGDLYSLKFRSVIQRRYNGIPNPALIDLPAETAPIPRVSPVIAIPDHFVHNLVTSALTLPPSPIFHDLRTVIRDQFPYWDSDWDGRLDAVASLLLAINLAILALGIGSALQTSGRAGAIPLLVFAAFCGINSIGRTSGGRYSVPMDWILLFYYALGFLLILQMARAIVAPASGSGKEASASGMREAVFPLRAVLRSAIPAFLVMFAVSTILIAWSSLVPRRYADASTEVMFEQFVAAGYVAQTEFEADDLHAFLQEEHAGIWSGRALYPRFYLAGQGVNILWKAFAPQAYPRLVFSLVGPQGDDFVTLPGPLPKVFPNASDVIVLGCKMEDGIVALIVVVQTPNPQVYGLPASVKLECPPSLYK